MWYFRYSPAPTFVRQLKHYQMKLLKLTEMLPFLSFSTLTDPQDIDTFSREYARCSGFVVQRDYYEINQVFAVSRKGRMIGGFVLGSGAVLRTLEVFAGNESRQRLYGQVGQPGNPTEMCCFWIDPVCRKKFWLNLYVWLCVAFALQVFGRQRLIFGTNSARLAALYNASRKSELIHSDCVREKQTFIFTGRRSDCLIGIINILVYKISRLLNIKRRVRNNQNIVVARVRKDLFQTVHVQTD